MKVRDDQIWSQQVSEINESEEGRRFLQFLTVWVDAAEDLIRAQYPLLHDGPEPDIIGPIRTGLQLAESEFGFLDIDVAGQMLVVIASHWRYGVTMTEQMTFIEARVMQQSLARKIADLQNRAVQDVSGTVAHGPVLDNSL